MKKGKYYGIATVLCLAMLTACSTGNPELDEMVSNTLITAAGTIGDSIGEVENAVSEAADAVADAVSDENTGDTVTDESAGDSTDSTDVTGATDAGDTGDTTEDTNAADTVAEDTATVDNTDAGDTVAEDNTVEDSLNAAVGYWDELQSPEYTYLQAIIADKGALGGVTYVAYIEDDWNEGDVHQCVEYERIVDYISIFEYADVVLHGGYDVYALMPGEGAYITVYSSEITENGEYVDDLDTPLYVGAIGEPILLKCNYSDVFSNVLVTVSDGDATCTLRPLTSGERVYVMYDADGWYDFGPFDLLTVKDEVFTWFLDNYEYYFRDAVDVGWTFEYLNSIYMYDHNALRFGLYPSDDSSITIDGIEYNYLEFAVDKQYTYMITNIGIMVIGEGAYFNSVELAEHYIETRADYGYGYSEGGVG